MNRKRREKLIRQFAAGKITWSKLRELGFDSYVHVLGELGKLKLRPPALVPNRETIEAMKAAGRGEVTTVGHPRKLLKSLNRRGP